MSKYQGYKPEDNARRKSNNTGDVMEDIGQNKNVKSYSSKPGQLTAAQQAEYEAKRMECINKMQPVKIYTKEEIAQLISKKAVS